MLYGQLGCGNCSITEDKIIHVLIHETQIGNIAYQLFEKTSFPRSYQYKVLWRNISKKQVGKEVVILKTFSTPEAFRCYASKIEGKE